MQDGSKSSIILKMELFTLPIKNHFLKGTIVCGTRKNPALIMIYVHGWSSSEKRWIWRVKKIADAIGGTHITFNLRGHGESSGTLSEFSRTDHLEDILAIYDFISKNFATKSIGICGSSYGAYLSAIATTKRKFNRLILREPALYRDEYFSQKTATLIAENGDSTFQQSGLTVENNMALKAVQKFQGDILFVESGIHDVLPQETIQDYRNVLQEKDYSYRFMKDSDHVMSKKENEEEFVAILIEWLKK